MDKNALIDKIEDRLIANRSEWDTDATCLMIATHDVLCEDAGERVYYYKSAEFLGFDDSFEAERFNDTHTFEEVLERLRSAKVH